MEEIIISLILRGCELARDLESNLQNIITQNQPNNLNVLSQSCDEIIRTFFDAKERLDNLNPNTSLIHHQYSSSQMLSYSQQAAPVLVSAQLESRRLQNVEPGLEECLRQSVTQAMEDVAGGQGQIILRRMFEMQGESSGVGRDQMGGSSSSTRMTGVRGDVPTMAVGSTLLQRYRRRIDDQITRTERVPVPQIGNTEIPPDDGHTWRKYGQKDILNSRFPRSYYRCTHQKMFNCPAKKQVQKLDDDQSMFEVKYRGEHTCHMSSTAPSAPPPPPPPRPQITQGVLQTITTATPIASPVDGDNLGKRLSMDVDAGGNISGCSSMVDPAGAGPSTVRFDHSRESGEHQYLHVANMADAMFNSGSSSSNSMDLIFSSMEDKN